MSPIERHAAAAREGRQAALRGETYASCPYSAAQGSATRVEAGGWRSGYQGGEVEQAEGSHFKETTR